ncbi:MAG TPA: ABC transporter substrate-binding protein [Candidatus Binatia bacterium]|nr:ABC transporter substrate-binding protein [Candidatus Binatia bacterium]
MHRRRWQCAALAATVSLLLSACGGTGVSPSGGATGSDSPSTDPGSSGDPGGASGNRDSITWVIDGQPGKISNGADDDPTADLAAFIYDALHQYNDAIESVPNLAECEPDADELVYTCTLVEATFHNGDPVTADDVKFSYDLAISENCTYNPSICLAGFVESVEVLDDRTVEITLLQTYSPFTTVILPALGIESQAVIQAAYDEFTGAAASLDPGDVRAASDAIAEPAGAEEPDAAGCEAALASAEELLTQAGVELPRREDHTFDGAFDPCSYGGVLSTDLLGVANSLEADGLDAVAAVYSLLPFQRDPIGTGPYRVAEFNVGQSVVLTAHEDYHGGTPATSTMNFVIITDLVAAASALAAGQVDFVEEMTPDAFEAVRNSEGVKIAEYPGFLHLELQFNVREGRIFSDVNLRRAMQLCIDKAGTVDAATNGTALATESETPPASWAFNPDVQGVERDVEAAQALIEESGWTLGDDGIYEKDGQRLEAEVLVRAGQSDRINFMQLFAEQVRECGTDITVNPADFQTVLLPALDRAWAEDGFDAYFGGWSASVDPDPYSLWHCDEVSTEERPETFNYIGYCNEEVDQIIEAGLATSDQDERRELYFRFQEILADEQPYLFAYAPLVRDGMHVDMRFTDGEFNLTSPTWLWQRHKIVIPES